MGNFNIPVTERALRTEKTHMKVSGQFASNKTAKYHAMVMTYLATYKKTESSVLMLKPYTVESGGTHGLQGNVSPIISVAGSF